jgi:uncharacterized Zn finger protein (UPF0148 family)
MKFVNYGGVKVEYSEIAPCRVCGLPVENASMGGVDLCPWCDMGVYRNGEKHEYYSCDPRINKIKIENRAKQIYIESTYHNREKYREEALVVLNKELRKLKDDIYNVKPPFEVVIVEK